MYEFNNLNGLTGLNAGSFQFGLGNGLSSGSGSLLGSGVTNPSNAASNFELGFNAPTLQMGLSGLNTIGNLWGAWQANQLARDQLDFTKSITNTNLNNSIQSYNTALADRARARGFTEGQSDAEIQDYVSRNSLSR